MRRALLLLLLCSSPICAGTSIFNIEVGESTIDDVRKNHTVISRGGTSRFEEVFEVGTENITFFNLVTLKLGLDSENRVDGVLASFGGKKFDVLFELLSKKYSIQKKNIPFVGNKYAKFINAGVSIELSQNHLGNLTELSYENSAAAAKYAEACAIEEEHREVKNLSLL